MSSSKAQKSGSSLPVYYLAFYNTLQFLGWTYSLFHIVYYLFSKKTHVGLWDDVKNGITLFQTLALLEVVHCIVAIVRSSAFLTFLQVFSRLVAVWAIVNGIPEVQNVYSVPLMLIAWCIAEVTRYSFYALSLLDICPPLLKWCRYSFFLLLYPCGVSGEILTMVAALPHIKENQMYSILLPNRANFSFSFYYAVLLIILSYIPFFPQLFLHMIHQRRKMIGNQAAKLHESSIKKE